MIGNMLTATMVLDQQNKLRMAERREFEHWWYEVAAHQPRGWKCSEEAAYEVWTAAKRNQLHKPVLELGDDDIESLNDSMCGEREFPVPFARAVLTADKRIRDLAVDKQGLDWIVSKRGTSQPPVETFAAGHTLEAAHIDAVRREPKLAGLSVDQLVFQRGGEIVTPQPTKLTKQERQGFNDWKNP